MFPTDRFSQKLARIASRLLTHRCTLITFTPTGDSDEGGHPEYEQDTVNNVSCLFLWNQVSRTDEEGTRLEDVATIYFSNSQTVNVGDIVQDLLAKDGTTTLLKNAKINTIDSTAEGGNATVKVCELEGVTL